MRRIRPSDHIDQIPPISIGDIEIASETDRWVDLCEKIKMYEREGAQFAIAIDPRTKATFARGDAPAALHIDLYAICAA